MKIKGEKLWDKCYLRNYYSVNKRNLWKQSESFKYLVPVKCSLLILHSIKGDVHSCFIIHFQWGALQGNSYETGFCIHSGDVEYPWEKFLSSLGTKKKHFSLMTSFCCCCCLGILNLATNCFPSFFSPLASLEPNVQPTFSNWIEQCVMHFLWINLAQL